MERTLGLDRMAEIRRVVRDKNTDASKLHLAEMFPVSIRNEDQEAMTQRELGRK